MTLESLSKHSASLENREKVNQLAQKVYDKAAGLLAKAGKVDIWLFSYEGKLAEHLYEGKLEEGHPGKVGLVTIEALGPTRLILRPSEKRKDELISLMEQRKVPITVKALMSDELQKQTEKRRVDSRVMRLIREGHVDLRSTLELKPAREEIPALLHNSFWRTSPYPGDSRQCLLPAGLRVPTLRELTDHLKVL